MEKSLNVEQGVAQGCSLSPILFSVFINDLLKEIEKAGLGVQLCNNKSITGTLFVNDFVIRGRSYRSMLMSYIRSYCNRWRLRV